MIQNIIKYGAGFILILLLQVVVVNNIYVFHLLHPYIYIWFLLMLPISTPKWALMLIGFVTGLLIDIFSYTPGMHAAASVLLCFVRPYILSVTAPLEKIKEDSSPNLTTLGFGNYALYASVLTLLHHSVLLFIEVFGFFEIEKTLLRVVLNTGISFALIYIAEMLASINRKVD